MPTRGKNWIPVERIAEVLQLEPALVVLVCALAAWLIYKLFMKNVTEERHGNLRRDFDSLFANLILSGVFIASFLELSRQETLHPTLERLLPYVALMGLLSGLVTLLKTLRILLYEYLIFSHMRVGVPVLILNIFTIVFGGILAIWVATSIFSVNLGPLLATSAFLSVVMGLALQDTLGNLFAGIAMQFDWKPYEIGDWIEIQTGSQKWTGQVNDISWRATTLLGFLDEEITVPNKVMAQSQINNYSTKERPMIRTQLYRFEFEAPVAEVREALMEAAAKVRDVRQSPKPLTLVSETTESWYACKLVYYIDDFGRQFLIADLLNAAVLEALQRRGLRLAHNRMVIERTA